MKMVLPDGRVTRVFFQVLLAIYDLTAVVGATTLAIYLRFDYLRTEFLINHEKSAPFVLASYLLFFYAFRLYRYRWSFAGMEAVWSVFFATLCASVLSIFLQAHIDGERMPYSISVMTCILATVFVGGQRILLRLFMRSLARRRAKTDVHGGEERKRTVIMGVEHSVVDVLTALTHDRAGNYDVIGILDPDTRNHGSYLRGIKVLGGWDLVHDLVRRHAVDEVIIALHNGSSAQLQEYVLACCRQKVAVRMVPVTADWLENPSASRRQLRVENIRVEDLLHRQSIQVESDEIGQYLTGKRVMVTGAGGSIGSELCRQISRHNPAVLILLGHGENSIHQVQLELMRSFPELASSLVAVICDVRDAARLDQVIKHYRPQVVFHTAAHKHVPLMEENAAEAVSNNVAGTRNVIRSSTRHGVERFVFISTDKAVNPSSVMGATKFLCEELVRAETVQSATCFLTVRFGNVLGSRGSVLPRFQEQILYGGPVTVTHPEMRRYFMTIPEAVSLVLNAGYIGASGELFVLDMGRPVRIVNLAEDVIRLSGLVPYRDIQIEFSGLRPGEKLSEELFTEHEQRVANINERMFIVNRPQCIEIEQLETLTDELLAVAAQQDDRQVLDALRRMIPAFREQADEVALPPASSREIVGQG